jgi:2-oxoglutarate decarboxylase
VSTQATNPQDNPLAGFGPNEWIVEDMYQRYLADPGSVDSAWHEFFADYKPGEGADSATAQSASAAQSAAVTQPAPTSQPAASAQARSSADRSAAAARAAARAPARPATPAPAPAKRVTPPAAPAAPSTTDNRTSGNGRNPETRVPLRGVAARIVQNMDASLAVPTATSVRAVPAKLLADNRIVINNHLTRGRGGKVSFTHLIGYAVVQALALHPEMNNSYASADGKPQLVDPGRVNLGIAIDLVKPDGTRTLVVPSLKNCESMDFRQFWGTSGAPAAAS